MVIRRYILITSVILTVNTKEPKLVYRYIYRIAKQQKKGNLTHLC